jgi:hypothetical protein
VPQAGGLDACIAHTQRPDQRKAAHLLPGKQRSSTSNSLITREIAPGGCGGRSSPKPSRARRRSTRGSNAGTNKHQEGKKRNAGSERSHGPRRNRSWPPEPPASGGGESLTLASAGTGAAAAAAAGRGWSTCIGSAAPAAWAPPGSAAMWRVGLRAETTRKWNLLSPLLCPVLSLSPR